MGVQAQLGTCGEKDFHSFALLVVENIVNSMR
jgi:hypothetical protein